jgi:hypothetical protein
MLGTCVPGSLFAGKTNPLLQGLQKHDCTNATDVCAPTLIAEYPNACFPRCTTNPTVQALGLEYATGACVPQFVVIDAFPSVWSGYTQEACGLGEFCVSCLDPAAGSASSAKTGACEQIGDPAGDAGGGDSGSHLDASADGKAPSDAGKPDGDGAVLQDSGASG